MEPLDDLDDLLRHASGEQNKELLTGQSVSRMIDERLTESRKKLASSFRKETIFIVIGILFMIFFLIMNISVENPGKGAMAKTIVYAGTGCYLLVCLFLFTSLMRLSLLQKGTHIRDYVTEIYKKTQSILKVYLWLSNTTGIAIGIVLPIFLDVSWHWTFLIALLLGIVLHYVNIWYIRRRFGKKLDEMKALIEAFN